MGDAYVWRPMLVSFKTASVYLYNAVAEVAGHLATNHVDPKGLMPILNNQLIPLDKNPRVRLVSIGEVLYKTYHWQVIMTVVKDDITRAGGVSQSSAGQPSGCEAVIHALQQVFASVKTDAVLPVDADKAFNQLNREVELHNIQYTCPPLATILGKIYCVPLRLFITRGMELSSQEGTTQGSVAMYALSVVPLTKKCQEAFDLADEPSVLYEAIQVWFPDGAAAGGKLRTLHKFCDLLVTHDPSYSYFLQPFKLHLVVKAERQAAAARIFEETGIHLTEEGDSCTNEAGQRHLGVAVGSAEYVVAYLDHQ